MHAQRGREAERQRDSARTSAMWQPTAHDGLLKLETKGFVQHSKCPTAVGVFTHSSMHAGNAAARSAAITSSPTARSSSRDGAIGALSGQPARTVCVAACCTYAGCVRVSVRTGRWLAAVQVEVIGTQNATHKCTAARRQLVFIQSP